MIWAYWFIALFFAIGSAKLLLDSERGEVKGSELIGLVITGALWPLFVIWHVWLRLLVRRAK